MAKSERGVRPSLQNIGLFFFDNWKKATGLFVILLLTGVLAYARFLPREGFPSIQFPLTVVGGTYFVDDAEQVDQQVLQPLIEAAEMVAGVTETQATAQNNSFSLAVFFEESLDPEQGTAQLQSAIDQADLPEQAQLNYTPIDPAAYLNKYDLLLVVQPHAQSELSTAELQSEAEAVAQFMAEHEHIALAETVPLITTATNPVTGQEESRQTAFNFFAEQQGSEPRLAFSPAVTIGIDKTDDIDLIELSQIVIIEAERIESLPEFATDEFWQSVDINIGADFARTIDTQINSLENNLFTGILAVVAVSWLIITWRASAITAVFMVSVMAVTMMVLLVLGYTLNTITLFALVLALGLFVDDSTIITEAIAASRQHGKKLRQAVGEALYKVGPASIAGTLTTVLVFLPLTFVTGILGEFIRLLPVTVIISLLVSLILSLTLIPSLAKFMFSTERLSKKGHRKERAEEAIAAFVAGGPALLKSRPWAGRTLAVAMVALSFGFLFLAGVYAQKVEFNIFPPSDDADQISISFEYAPGTTLEEATALAEQANQVISEELGENGVRALYGGFNMPNARSADVVVELRSYTQREVTAAEISNNLQSALSQTLGDQARVSINQIDSGPPSEDLPFKVQIVSENAELGNRVAQDLQSHLQGATLTRPTGTTADIARVEIRGNQSINRQNGDRFVEVAASFSGDDTSALLELAQSYVEEEFTEQRLRDYGPEVALSFDFGQESESAESFAALQVVFPVAIGAILLLLAIQFRSVLQPLLIILAIPFSLLGVFYGLYVTDNALSFFSNVGIIGLLGIAVNNTILLTDYANQERRAGADKVTAITNALRERLRPLITTTLTTIVALLPLAINDPFWEPLAVTIIFGLASSTILVVLSFPYYYLATESLTEFTRRTFTKLRRR